MLYPQPVLAKSARFFSLNTREVPDAVLFLRIADAVLFFHPFVRSHAPHTHIQRAITQKTARKATNDRRVSATH
eukprot:COSAG06_NODE_1202_length_10285_cov_57.400648_8_plen_74_part_00